jgi:two-component system LytT family response regulator
VGSSIRSRPVRALIVNGAGAIRARPHLDVDSGVTNDLQPAAGQGSGFWPLQIIGEKSGRIYFLDASDVEYVASAGNYIVAHLGADGYLARVTLKRMMAWLAPVGFVQIDRSLLVNLRRVAHVERADRGKYCFVMRSGERLVSSRDRRASIRRMLLGAMAPRRA